MAPRAPFPPETFPAGFGAFYWRSQVQQNWFGLVCSSASPGYDLIGSIISSLGPGFNQRFPRQFIEVLKTPTRWHKLSMISAISARGECAFQIVEGSINTTRFLEFLGRLIEGATRKIFLVVDNLRVHHAKQVSEWLQDKQDRIELVFLPPYAPESNPDEYLNRDFKTALRSGPVSQNAEALLEKAHAFMNRIAALPNHVAAYFRHPAAAYAAQGI